MRIARLDRRVWTAALYLSVMLFAPAEERAIGVERWKQWLEDYRSTL